jgi:hypothetical protein
MIKVIDWGTRATAAAQCDRRDLQPTLVRLLIERYIGDGTSIGRFVQPTVHISARYDLNLGNATLNDSSWAANTYIAAVKWPGDNLGDVSTVSPKSHR